MPWTTCEDCIHEPQCDWPDQLYGGCECGDPKEKEYEMEELEKILCKLIVPVVGDHGMELIELGHSMVNDSGDEMDKYGLELIQIGNHIAEWTMDLMSIADPKAAKELQPKYDALIESWEKEHPGVPFLR